MQPIKIKKEEILLFIFIVLFLLTRGTHLGKDEINPDAVNWHTRSEQFVVGLKTFDFQKTYQHYHPGVSLMWVVGPTVEFIKQMYPSENVYTQFNFEVFHFASKFILVFVQLTLTLIILYQLAKIIGFVKAYFAVSLFSLEPFFVGNSRLLHLDVLLTLFLFLSLLFAYRGLKEKSIRLSLLSGVFLSLSFLTKSIAVGGLIFVSLMYILNIFRTKDRKYLFGMSGVILLSFIISLFLLFPALWVEPLRVLTDIFNEAARIGLRKGHGQVVMNEYTRNAPFYFYLLASILKVSPFTILGIFLFVLYAFKSFYDYIKKGSISKNIHFSEIGDLIKWAGIFYLGYFIVISFSSKKIDRYLVPEFPFLSLLAVDGYFRARNLFKSYYFKFILIFFVIISIFYPLYKLFPYYFTYTSPLFGSSVNANKFIAQKSFGIGIQDVRDIILGKYRHYPRLGFVDSKPMRAIYMNSRTKDIRVDGTGDYDLLVLGINDEYNEDIQEMDIKFLNNSNEVIINNIGFAKDTSIYINGLEFWRIYVKENTR